MEIDRHSRTSRDPFALGNSLSGFLPPLRSLNTLSEGTVVRKKGVIVGKFWPFHLGHQYLCEKALEHCDELYIIVCYCPDEYPSLDIRVSWIRHSLPTVYCMGINNVYNATDSELWAELTKSWCQFIPDIVFTSELYGIRWASFLGCEHVMVDHNRDLFPISGTLVRDILYNENQYKKDYFKTINSCWKMLPWIVQHHFTKQVIVVMSDYQKPLESEVSKQLAIHFQGIYVHHDQSIESSGYDWKQCREEEFSAIKGLDENNHNKLLFQDSSSLLWNLLRSGNMSSIEDKSIFYAVKEVLVLCLLSDSEYKAIITEEMVAKQVPIIQIDSLLFEHLKVSEESLIFDNLLQLCEGRVNDYLREGV